MRRIWLGIGCVLLLLSVSTSYAYLHDKTEPIYNTLTEVHVQAEIVEDFDPNSATSLVPGQTVEKAPRIKNTGDIDAYVAMRVKFVSGDSAKVTDEEIKQVLTLNNLPGDNWELYEEEDDYLIFIYNEPVAPDEETTDLFSSVYINSEWKTRVSFDIVLDGLAIQTEGMEPSHAGARLKYN